MKKYLKIFFSIIVVIVILAVVFCIVDVLRVHGDEEPIFTFIEGVADGDGFSAKINIGLGYKIVRYSAPNQTDVIKIGTIFMKVKCPFELTDDNDSGDKNYVIIETNTNASGESLSGESGEKIVKLTTFGEKYSDIIMLEGMEETVNIKRINSKIGYSMNYYYELFDYSGFDDHDKYIWNRMSGDSSNAITIHSISGEEEYNEIIKKIEEDKDYSEVSGEEVFLIKKAYFKAYNENDVNKVSYIYMIWIDDLKFKVEYTIPQEAEEGIGTYMRKMIYSISA